MQLFSVLKYAPPPAEPAELPLSVQLFSALIYAPPPSTSAALPVSVQLFSVLPDAPPPQPAELPLSTQLDTTAPAEGHHTPPPLLAVPLVSVKPTSAAPSPR